MNIDTSVLLIFENIVDMIEIHNFIEAPCASNLMTFDLLSFL